MLLLLLPTHSGRCGIARLAAEGTHISRHAQGAIVWLLRPRVFSAAAVSHRVRPGVFARPLALPVLLSGRPIVRGLGPT